MQERFDEADQRRLRISARLAVLQRLREEMAADNRVAMLKSIEQLMETERVALQEIGKATRLPGI